MEQTSKELLIKDLAGRLPYGVKSSTKVGGNIKISFMEEDTIIGEDGDSYDISFITPYLFPLSSMTEDQKYEFYLRFIAKDCDFYYFKFYLDDGKWHKLPTSLNAIEAIIDWFHKNHIDYRGLIPMGLAIDATNKNIY